MELFYTSDRNEWHEYLVEHFETAAEIWFVFPDKGSGEDDLSYHFEGNSAAHLKSSMIGFSEQIIIDEGRPDVRWHERSE